LYGCPAGGVELDDASEASLCQQVGIASGSAEETSKLHKVLAKRMISKVTMYEK